MRVEEPFHRCEFLSCDALPESYPQLLKLYHRHDAEQCTLKIEAFGWEAGGHGDGGEKTTSSEKRRNAEFMRATD